MVNLKLKKLAISGVAALALSPIATTLGNGIFTSQIVQAATVPSSEDTEEVTYISNKEIFDYFEEQGYSVKSVLGEEEYHACLMQDLMRAGGTYVKFHKNGFTVYINSAICKLAVYGGASVLAGAIGAVVNGIGATPLVVGAVKATVQGVIDSAGAKAAKRGIYVKFNKKGKMLGWGYQ